jgi:integrase
VPSAGVRYRRLSYYTAVTLVTQRESCSLLVSRRARYPANVQRGTIRKQHGAWFLLYRRTEIVDGQPVRKQVTHRLAPVNDEFRSVGDVRELAEKVIDRENAGRVDESAVRFADFVRLRFLPYIQGRKAASTVLFYRKTLERDVSPVIGEMRLRDVRTVHIQRLLDARNKLSHQSLLRIKSAASGVFSYAKREDYIDINPCVGTRAEGRRSDFEGVAYTLKDLQFFLQKLSEPARSVIAVAGFTGLRLAEIRGLQWSDYNGKELLVRRTVWRTVEGATKTPESRAVVPVISPLKKVLDAHKRRDGTSLWIFSGDKKGFSLHLDNLARRVIKPALKGRWHGWHSFRRGLATILYDLGVDPEVSSKILRHADSTITRRFYVMLQSRKQGRAAMKRLERTVVRRF